MSVQKWKTLGVVWQADKDMFTFRVDTDKLLDSLLKRLVWKIIARLFDPIWFVSPCIVQGKIMIMWCDSYDWDDPLENELKQKVQNWFNKLPELNEVKDRISLNFNPEVTSSIHVFIYTCFRSCILCCNVCKTWIRCSSVDIGFVGSKAKVAPLKSTSIPHIELMAAILGVSLAMTVVQSLQLEMKQVVFWTVSLNVLGGFTGRVVTLRRDDGDISRSWLRTYSRGGFESFYQHSVPGISGFKPNQISRLVTSS